MMIWKFEFGDMALPTHAHTILHTELYPQLCIHAALPSGNPSNKFRAVYEVADQPAFKAALAAGLHGKDGLDETGHCKVQDVQLTIEQLAFFTSQARRVCAFQCVFCTALSILKRRDSSLYVAFAMLPSIEHSIC